MGHAMVNASSDHLSSGSPLGRGMMRLAMRRLAPGVLAALVTLAVVLRIGIVVNRRIDPDESQHLHVAWLVMQGQVPYRDFWEHHLPFFHYAMAPLTWWLADRPEIYFAGRALMVAMAAAAIVLTWHLARRLSVDGAVWAVVVLLFLPQFAETSTETRPDVPALTAHLASLLALVSWREGRGSGALWAVGAWQGVALALSLKAVFGLAGVLAVAAGMPPPHAEPGVHAGRRACSPGWRAGGGAWDPTRWARGYRGGVDGPRPPSKRCAGLARVRRLREDVAHLGG